MKCSFCDESSIVTLLIVSNGKISEVCFCEKHLAEYKSPFYQFKISKEMNLRNEERPTINYKPKDNTNSLKTKLAEAFGIEEDEIIDVDINVIDDCENCEDREYCDIYQKKEDIEDLEEDMEEDKEVTSYVDNIISKPKKIIDIDTVEKIININEETDVRTLDKLMREAAQKEDFILAAKIRDRIKNLNE